MVKTSSTHINNNSEIIIYQNPNGNIKIDVRLEEENVWLTQKLMVELFQKSKATISEHIKNIFQESELIEDSVVRDFRTTAKNYLNEEEIKLLGLLVEQYLAFAETMAQQHTPMYMKDWISRLDNILKINGRELLNHAGKISHEMVIEKSNQEFKKYKEEQKKLTIESSLKELEEDIKQIENRGKIDFSIN